MGEMFIHHHFLRAPIIEKFVFFCFRCFVLKKSPFTRMNFAIHFDRTRPQRLFFFQLWIETMSSAERSNGLDCCGNMLQTTNQTTNRRTDKLQPKCCKMLQELTNCKLLCIYKLQTLRNAARCTTKNELVCSMLTCFLEVKHHCTNNCSCVLDRQESVYQLGKYLFCLSLLKQWWFVNEHLRNGLSRHLAPAPANQTKKQDHGE